MEVNKRSCAGNTPILEVAMGNSTEAIALLVKHGALINITNDTGEKPIDRARSFQNEAAVRMLEQL